VCVGADDEIVESPSVASKDVSCFRILPKISDASGLNVLPCGELASDDSPPVSPAVSASCGLLYDSCHKWDPGSDRCADAVADGLPEEKLLPSLCDANVGGVTVADVHLADSSPQEKLLPSLHETDLSSGGCIADTCATDADTCATDAQPVQKLLPSSADVVCVWR